MKGRLAGGARRPRATGGAALSGRCREGPASGKLTQAHGVGPRYTGWPPKNYCMPASYGTLHNGAGACGAFEYKRMTIYRTRYRDPKEHHWLSAWVETRVGAEMRRAGIETKSALRRTKLSSRSSVLK
jgi:hypothetical protein